MVALQLAAPRLALGLVAAVLVYALPALHSVPGYGSRPAGAAAVGALMATWWLLEALPLWATSLVPLVAFPALGIFGSGPAQGLASTASEYANAYMFLFLGGMALGAAMEHWGLHRRIALGVLARVGSSTGRLLLGMLLGSALVSLWISNTATAVMMSPIALAVLSQLEASEGRRLHGFGMALLLAVAYGANLGGIGTKIGTATNSILVGYAGRVLHQELTFAGFLALGLPFVVLFLPVCWAALYLAGRDDGPGPASGAEVVRTQLQALGPLAHQERRVALTFGLAAALWMLSDPLRALLPMPLAGRHFEAAVSVSAAGLAWLQGCLPLAALRRVPLSALALLGGSFALAAGIEASGLSVWLGGQLTGLAALPAPAQHGLAALSAVGLSALASNTATVNVLLPLVPQHLPLLATLTIAASCDFALPAGTPPNAIVFGTGRIHLRGMVLAGAALDVAAAALLTGYGAWYLEWLLD